MSRFSRAATEKLEGPYDSFERPLLVVGSGSAWPMVSPRKGMIPFIIIEASDPVTVKKSLQESAKGNGEAVACVDVTAGIEKYGSAFIRGQVILESDGSSYSRGKQPWLTGPGVYIFDNHDALISSPDALLELLRGLYACRLAELEGAGQHDSTPMQNISICFIVEKGQYRAFVEAHNRLRPHYTLIQRVEMSI